MGQHRRKIVAPSNKVLCYLRDGSSVGHETLLGLNVISHRRSEAVNNVKGLLKIFLFNISGSYLQSYLENSYVLVEIVYYTLQCERQRI